MPAGPSTGEDGLTRALAGLATSGAATASPASATDATPVVPLGAPQNGLLLLP